MAESWEVSARKARQLTNDSGLRKLRNAQKQICEKIKKEAMNGGDTCCIDFRFYDVSMPEDWAYIYNWLNQLGYDINDRSKERKDACFIVQW